MPRSNQKRKIDELLVKVVESKSSPNELHWMTVISAHVEEIKDLKLRLQLVNTELSESYRRTIQMLKNPIVTHELKKLDHEEISKDFIILKYGEHLDLKDPDNNKQFKFEKSFHKIPRLIHGVKWQ